MSELNNNSHTRREVLAATGVAVTGATTGCGGLPDIGQPSSALAPFKQGWVEIQQDGSADIILSFDGDIQQQMNMVDMFNTGVTEAENFDVSQGSVEIPRTPDLSSQQTVEGTVNGYVEVDTNWPGARWYFTGLVSLSENVTLVEDAKFHVRFPNGYEYEFPTIHQDITGGLTDVQRGDEGALTDYGDNPKESVDRTIPFINHYNHPALVWMRVYSEYRFKLLVQTIPLFDWDKYAEDFEEHMRRAVSELSLYLSESAVTSIISSGVPSNQVTTAFTRFEDLKSFHDALNRDYDEFQTALESLETLTMASVNETWMSVLTPKSDAGLPRLARLSEDEWRVRNPVLTTAYSQDRFVQRLNEYQECLNNQREITQRILSNSKFTDVPSFGGDEWAQLKQQASQLVGRLDTHINRELSALNTIRGKFS